VPENEASETKKASVVCHKPQRYFYVSCYPAKRLGREFQKVLFAALYQIFGPVIKARSKMLKNAQKCSKTFKKHAKRKLVGESDKK